MSEGAHILLATAALLAVATYVAAQDARIVDSGVSFCVGHEPEVKLQKTCVEEWWFGHKMFMAYGEQAGLVGEDGAASLIGSIWLAVKGSFSERKTPVFVISECSDETGFRDANDFRALWACIKTQDPEAALLEAE